MTGLTSSNRYMLYRGIVDFRNGFDGLCGLVQRELGGDPADGSVWIFINRLRDRMKMLAWEPGGFMLYYKRLKSGTIEYPGPGPGQGKIVISWAVLVMMLEGIRVNKIVHKKGTAEHKYFYSCPIFWHEQRRNNC